MHNLITVVTLISLLFKFHDHSLFLNYITGQAANAGNQPKKVHVHRYKISSRGEEGYGDKPRSKFSHNFPRGQYWLGFNEMLSKSCKILKKILFNGIFY